jgi:hypothetical protein
MIVESYVRSILDAKDDGGLLRDCPLPTNLKFSECQIGLDGYTRDIKVIKMSGSGVGWSLSAMLLYSRSKTSLIWVHQNIAICSRQSIIVVCGQFRRKRI